MKKISILLLILALLCIGLIASASADITVDTKFNQTSYSVGEEITAEYTVNGSYDFGFYECHVIVDGQDTIANSGKLLTKSGKINYTASENGTKSYIRYNIEYDDESYKIDSQEVAILQPVDISTAFPDEALRKYVKQQFDKNGDGLFSQEEMNAVTHISVKKCGIKTAKGIELFPNLKTLYLSSNELDSLDVSKNVNLSVLECAENQLKELVVDSNTELTVLRCGKNQIQELNVRNNKKLQSLSCYENRLTELIVSENTKLETLSCYSNKLKKLELQNNPDLRYLSCESNQLKELDLKNQTKLRDLYCSYNEIKELAVKQMTNLSDIRCSGNLLQELDLSGKTQLLNVYCDDNQLKKLDVSASEGLFTLDCAFNQIEELKINPNAQIYNLYCYTNNLEKLDVSTLTNLGWLICNQNGLTELDVSNNTNLYALECAMNYLTSLTIGNNERLNKLSCSYNPLTSLDVSGAPSLRDLDFYSTQINKVDLSHCAALANLVTTKEPFTEHPETLYWGDSETDSFLWANSNETKIIPVPVAGITMEKNNLNIAAGESKELIVSIEPTYAGNQNVRWESDHPEYATVDTKGCITGVKAGEAVITAITEDGHKTAMCTVTVTGIGPVNPTNPVDPTNPTNPSNPNNPTNPTNPTNPSNPSNPSYPTNPTNSTNPSNPTNPVEPVDKVEAFVTRCYQIILGRQPDAGGMKTWYNELVSGRKAASEIIDNFVRSQEFLGKHYSNADAVEILYKTMLGRGSDAPGKATWVGKLDAGYPFAVVINGFCGSKEFKEICDSYGIAPGSVSMGQESVSDQQIRAFVTRCYKIILGRDPDEVGMNTWFSELKSRRRTAAEIIEQFVYSQEFRNRKYSNPDTVEILYKAMLGRGSDPAGKADWVGRLNAGQPLTAIINGFCGSMEFTAICEAYGITPGSVKVETVSRAAEEAPEETVQKPEKKANLIEITNASDTVNEQLGTAVQAIYINEEKAKEFIGRCYQAILGREASQAELDSWIGQMTNGSKNADQIARGFLFSGEFKDKNVSNEELVKILYRVYMNREADAEGLATWTQKLDEGTGLNDLLNVFAKTGEFKAVLKNMAE